MAAVTQPVPQLAEGQHVTVRHVHLGLLPGRVEAAGHGNVTVALTAKDDRVGRLVGQDIAVELMSGRGIYRHTGKLSAERNSSLTIARSSFNSLIVASILPRLNSLIGNPCTISSVLPLLRIGNDVIKPFSIP